MRTALFVCVLPVVFGLASRCHEHDTTIVAFSGFVISEKISILPDQPVRIEKHNWQERSDHEFAITKRDRKILVEKLESSGFWDWPDVIGEMVYSGEPICIEVVRNRQRKKILIYRNVADRATEKEIALHRHAIGLWNCIREASGLLGTGK